MNKLNPANEPVLSAAVTTVISWIAGRYAIDMDASTATAVSLVVFAVASWVARRFSVPVVKAEAAISTALQTQPTALTVDGGLTQSKEILAGTKP